ncbi:MliC family protein [Sodalis sp. dw_96]|uniref:MliC family protein n=1 Tax=Sodalis sp. dw_96 TaxID=2719794 RepID=UPI001BD21D25|nr:MliC family protein [Sodalis sp. dw_96]
MKRVIFCLTVITVLATGACSRLHRGEEVQVLHYQCGTTPLTVRQNNRLSQVSLILDGKQLTLPRVVSASDVPSDNGRYDNGHYVFWSKGNRAFIERDGRVIIDDCILNGESGK